MGVSERLSDADVRHQIGLARVSAATTRKIVALLARTEADILAQIRRLSWDDVSRAAARAARLERMLEAVRAAGREGNAVLGRALRADLEELAVYEAEFQAEAVARIAQRPTVGPSVSELKAAVNSRPFQGRVLREWVTDLDEGSYRRLRDAIRIGYVEGETVDSIVRRVRGTAASGYRDGIMEIGRRGAEALVRTAVTHTASSAKEEFFKANASVFSGVRWSSVLDSRTTPICQARDGRIYPVGEGPRPPAHIRCRSTVVGVLRGQAPPQVETYQGWLERQPREVQDDVLGPTRARLFRSGGLEVDRFTDAAGRRLTIEQLRRRERSAFERAGL